MAKMTPRTLSGFMELLPAPQQQMERIMALMEEHNENELKKPCNDAPCMVNKAQYYAVKGEEASAKECFLEALKMASDAEEKVSVLDKYAMFLHGNNGLSRVEGDGSGKILVLKDSYANCFVPYLTANYAAIDVVDFRNYNYGLDPLIAANDYDQILVLYSFDSFKSDPYLYRAGVAG